MLGVLQLVYPPWARHPCPRCPPSRTWHPSSRAARQCVRATIQESVTGLQTTLPPRPVLEPQSTNEAQTTAEAQPIAEAESESDDGSDNESIIEWESRKLVDIPAWDTDEDF
jgi:hypothetical protein